MPTSTIIRPNGSQTFRDDAISASLLASDFSIVAIARRPVSTSGVFNRLAEIEDSSGNPVVAFVIRDDNGRVLSRFVTDNPDGGNNQLVTDVDAEAQPNWFVAVLTWDASEEEFSAYNVSHLDGTTVTASASTIVEGVFRTPDRMQLISTSGNRWNGDVACVALRSDILTLSDAIAIFESKSSIAPMTHNNPDLGDSGDRVIRAWNYGICQRPVEAGVTRIEGTRIGSAVAEGNVLIHAAEENLDIARPVTIGGSLTYETSDWFEIAAVDKPLATQGNSGTLKRWGANAPVTQHRICMCGRSRVTRGANHPPVGEQTDIPFGYSQSWLTGIALHHLDTLGGLLGMWPAGGGRWPGWELHDGSFWTSGTVTNTISTDLVREWLLSSQGTGPSRGSILSNGAQASYKHVELPGSLLLKSAAVNTAVTYLRGPGCSDIQYRAVEGNDLETRGDFVGDEQQTSDANTTQFTHEFGAGDTYNEAAKRLTLPEWDAPNGDPHVGWRIAIVSGAGAGSFAEIESIDGDELTLRHEFDTAPTNGSVLAFGPVSYGMVTVQNPPSLDDWRGIWVEADVDSNEIGAVILALHVWRSDVPCFHFGMVGWGANFFTTMLATVNSDVIARIMDHIGYDAALLIEGYGAAATSHIITQFEAFADAVDDSNATVPIYLVGNSNAVNDLTERNYHEWAINGQTDRSAISVVGSPRLGTDPAQYGYSGKENQSHGSIDVYVRAAAELAALADAEFEAAEEDEGAGDGASVPAKLLLLLG